MERVRRAALAAIFLVLATGVVIAGTGSGGARESLLPAALVSWPPSPLVISEVQTGGTSASDEFVELANAGTVTVDLAGLEVVYVTASGGTITRKASWPGTLLLEPGRHLLIANSLGAHASVADLTYSGGLAATGGTLVIRAIGGGPIDAIGWGDAVNTFVEGAPAPAATAGSSLERRPGGAEGNGTDTNDNLADFVVQGSPSPQPLASPPVPAPTMTEAPSSAAPSGTPASSSPPSLPPATETPGTTASPPPAPATPSPPSATEAPSAEPSPTGSPTHGPDPSGSPRPGEATPVPSVPPTTAPSESPPPWSSPAPTQTPPVDAASPSPTITAPPASSPSPASPSPESPSPEPPTPLPSQVPSPEPSGTPAPAPSTPAPTELPGPTPLTVVEARALPIGAPAVVRGVLTTPLGLLEDGRLAFLEDATAGVAIYLDAAPDVVRSAGTAVVVSGELDERYGARTLRVALAAIVVDGSADMPTPLAVSTGAVGEDVEGRRVAVTGLTVGSPTAYADGTGLLVDDGSGPVRAIVAPDVLAGRSIPPGTRVTVAGPVGQRDSTGSGTSGYRLYVSLPADLVVDSSPSPDESPDPSASPSTDPGASPTPTPTNSPAPSPSVSPSSTPGPTAAAGPTRLSIAEARRLRTGAVVAVAGVVTAEAGRLGSPALLAVEDATGGIIVRLADGMPPPARGLAVELAGVIAAPYGQQELRLRQGGLRVQGSSALPVPAPVTAAQLGEAIEARLVVVAGSVATTPRRSTSNDIAFDLVDVDGGRIRLMADASSGLSTSSVRAGRSYRLTGIVGQRQSRKDALDGYRVWLRDALDLVPVADPVPPGPSAGPVSPIAAARSMIDVEVTIEGTVTVPARLLDATNRRIIVQDRTGAIEVLLPAGSEVPAPGRRVRAQGVVGRAYGAPRLRATRVELLAGPASVDPRALDGPPGEPVEWQVVRVSGTIGKVTRLGARWRAAIETGGREFIIDGLPGSSIPSTALLTGRRATVTGIVKRPYPGATDARFSIVPRSPADLVVGPGPGAAVSRTSSDADPGHAVPFSGASESAVGLEAVVDADLGALAEHAGQRVRVGGLLVQELPTGFTLDDGTATGAVILVGPATAYLAALEPGDAVNAIGLVIPLEDDHWGVQVTDGRGLLRVGDLGEPRAIDAGGGVETRATDPAPDQEHAPARQAGRLGFDLAPVGGVGAAAVASLALTTALGLSAAVARRRRARQLADRVAARLQRYAGAEPDAA
jgi:hypothetical protein